MEMETEDRKTTKPCVCQGCRLEFPSRNAVFTHLIETNGSCLPAEELEDFRKYVLANRKRQKVMILYGYIPGMDVIKSGQDAAVILLETLAAIYREFDDLTEQQLSELLRVNRSYGCTARSTALVEQDEGTGAITEVLATRLPAEANAQPLKDWLKLVNKKVAERLLRTRSVLRVFGKLDAPSQFNAEMDVGHRRIEYLFPVDLLVAFDEREQPYSSTLTEFFERFPTLFDGSLMKRENISNAKQHDGSEILAQSPSACRDEETIQFLYSLKKIMQSLTTNIVKRKLTAAATAPESSLLDGKNIRKTRNRIDRRDTNQRQETKHDNLGQISNQIPDRSSEPQGNEPKQAEKNGEGKKYSKAKKKTSDESSKFVLERKRYHNFTPNAVAHEYLCLRRLDRFYHRATLRLDMKHDPPSVLPPGDDHRKTRPFLVLSLTGDVFLNGQVPRILGLFVALARGVIGKDMVDCVFDEQYPHLVPTPPLPSFAMYAGEAMYPKWEGKLKTVLSPRRQDKFEGGGWNDVEIIDAVEEWAFQLRQHAATQWNREGICSSGRLISERNWTNEVLLPWARKANQQLEHYRQWKNSRNKNMKPAVHTDIIPSASNNFLAFKPTTLPILGCVDPEVPAVYQKVLYYLRKANESGLWPSTTPKRQLVMVSTRRDDDENTQTNKVQESSLNAQCIRAKTNVRDLEASAYEYEEGQGGASGSFSVGAMPGDLCAQPKGNSLFPELMRVAFELEIALCPEREPSSTIAINRNAQFRPHTDSGAGAGQSTSLIAGLGTYTGGELVVEGAQHDIRYKALEFNGWKQRHWTMPFVGERYSLVWFTPKGCEGVRGIDLCK